MTMNHFTPLYNLQKTGIDPCGLQEQNKQISTQDMNPTMKQHRTGMNIPTVGGKLMYCNNWKPTPMKKQTAQSRSTSLTDKKHKVKILGDSHLKGTATGIDLHLNTQFKVCSWVKLVQKQKN